MLIQVQLNRSTPRARSGGLFPGRGFALRIFEILARQQLFDYADLQARIGNTAQFRFVKSRRDGVFSLYCHAILFGDGAKRRRINFKYALKIGSGHLQTLLELVQPRFPGPQLLSRLRSIAH